MSWEDKKQRNNWINDVEICLQENYRIENETIFNNNGDDFPDIYPITLNTGGRLWLSFDKSIEINNKKMWILYLPVPNGYDSIGIKTDDNTGKQRVLKYRLIKYKNKNHSEIFFNNQRKYTGIWNWFDNGQTLLNETNALENHYLIISDSIKRTNQQKWNGLGHSQKLWLITANANDLMYIFDNILR